MRLKETLNSQSKKNNMSKSINILVKVIIEQSLELIEKLDSYKNYTELSEFLEKEEVAQGKRILILKKFEAIQSKDKKHINLIKKFLKAILTEEK